MYDFYCSKSEPDERMAVLKGTGLPSHVDPADWALMNDVRESSPEKAVEYLDEDINARGFCYFKLVPHP